MNNDDDNDRYERTNTSRGLSNAVDEALDLSDAEFLKRDDAWWAARDQQVAELRAREQLAAERERMRRRAIDLERRGGFPGLHIDTAMRGPSDTPAMMFARRFPLLPSLIVVFAGGVGSGKTTAACWLAMKSEDHDPGFIRASTLERRGRYDKKLEEWLRERTSLVIDDLGVEVLDGKRVFASFLDEIVDAFYSKRAPLIMTTNLHPRVTAEMVEEAKKENREPEPQFVERYGDRVRSRIRQIGQWAECGTLDLRKPGPQA